MKKSPYFDRTMADVYNRVAAPHQFAAPARDLVQILQLRIGDRALDVGTGTGAAAVAAATVLESAGSLVGVDASIEMLHFAQSSAGNLVAVAQVPEPPFLDSTFDVPKTVPMTRSRRLADSARSPSLTMLYRSKTDRVL